MKLWDSITLWATWAKRPSRDLCTSNFLHSSSLGSHLTCLLTSLSGLNLQGAACTSNNLLYMLYSLLENNKRIQEPSPLEGELVMIGKRRWQHRLCDSSCRSPLTGQNQQRRPAESSSGQSNHPVGHQKTITHSNESVCNLFPQMKRPPFPPSITLLAASWNKQPQHSSPNIVRALHHVSSFTLHSHYFLFQQYNSTDLMIL